MQTLSKILEMHSINDGWTQTEIQTRTPTSSDSESLEIKGLYPTEKGWLSRIPEDFRDLSLETCNELPHGLIQFGRQWARSLHEMKSLYLYGKYGSGKTTFAFAIIREIMRVVPAENYFWPNYYTGRQLDTQLLKASKHDEGDEWEIEKHSTADLLFIDDLDKVNPTERFKNQMFEIINRRMTSKKPTIITSNCMPSEMDRIIDGAVISRLSDVKKWQRIEFPDIDLRKQQVLRF